MKSEIIYLRKIPTSSSLIGCLILVLAFYKNKKDIQGNDSNKNSTMKTNVGD